MSKTYKNTIPIFAERKRVEKLVKTIKTTGVDYTKEPMPTEGDIVFTLFSYLAEPSQVEEMRKAYTDDRSFGYGQAKLALIDLLSNRFGGEKFERFQEIRQSMKIVETRLNEGARIAQSLAKRTMSRVREAMGLPYLV
jgi:tryptophanyl-tRNA synthetase